MHPFKRILINIVLVLCSLLFCLAVLEAGLRLLGKYSSIADIELKPTNTIWSRYENSIELFAHPDLEFDVEVKSDDQGVRNHRETSSALFVDQIGFFGDSFTENRRIDDQFTFTTLLNKFWNKHSAINFGIDGFGLEQSLQHYLNKKDVFNLQDVVYVFCSNDFRNLYEVQLLTVKKNGDDEYQIENLYDQDNISLETRIYRFLGKFHTTYFLLEAHYIIKGKFKPSNRALAGKYAKKVFPDGERKHEKRHRNDYADQLVDRLFVDDPDQDVYELALRFTLTLQAWKNTVEKNGGNFYIAVLPRDIDRTVIQRILELGKTEDHFQLLNLPTPQDIPALSDFSVRFRNDGHWNEIGNLAILPELIAVFSDRRGGTPDLHDVEVFLESNLSEILNLYREYDSQPNPLKAEKPAGHAHDN